MYTTLKTLYPEEFKISRQKKKKRGFLRRRIRGMWNFCKSSLLSFGKARILMFLFLLAIIATGLYTIYVYNYFTTCLNNVRTAKAHIDREIQRRNDLTMNIVYSAVNYLAYEKDMFSHVAEIRKDFTNLSSAVKGNQGGSGMLDGGIKVQLPALLGIFENYPDLKASTPFTNVMKELIETENRVAMVRAAYNDSANVYNIYLETIPASWIGTLFGLKKEALFVAEEKAHLLPDLKKLAPVNYKQ